MENKYEYCDIFRWRKVFQVRRCESKERIDESGPNEWSCLFLLCPSLRFLCLQPPTFGQPLNSPPHLSVKRRSPLYLFLFIDAPRNFRIVRFPTFFVHPSNNPIAPAEQENKKKKTKCGVILLKKFLVRLHGLKESKREFHV